MINWKEITEIYYDKYLGRFFAYKKETDENFQLKTNDFPDAIKWLKDQRVMSKVWTDLMYHSLLAEGRDGNK